MTIIRRLLSIGIFGFALVGCSGADPAAGVGGGASIRFDANHPTQHHGHKVMKYHFRIPGVVQQIPSTATPGTSSVALIQVLGQYSRDLYPGIREGQHQLSYSFTVPTGSQYPIGLYTGGSPLTENSAYYETEFQGPAIFVYTYWGSLGAYLLYPHDNEHSVLYPIGVTLNTTTDEILMTATTNGADSVLYECDPASGAGAIVAQLTAHALHPADAAAYAPDAFVATLTDHYWFAEPGADKIAVYTVGAGVTEFSLVKGHEPNDLVLGPDGALWFVEFGAPYVGRLTTSGQLSEYSIASTGSSNAESISTDFKNRRLYFTLQGQASTIGQITEKGVVSTLSANGLNIAVPEIAVNGLPFHAYFIEANDIAQVNNL